MNRIWKLRGVPNKARESKRDKSIKLEREVKSG